MKRIIITGATSFIGVHLIEKWLEKEAEIYAIIRPQSKNAERIPEDEHIHIMELRLEEYSKLPELIDSAEYFYHLAWEGARAPYRDNVKMQYNNYECALQAYESAKKLGCSFFLGSGSQAEYGLTNGMVNEEYPCKPTSEYGKQKLNTCKELLRRAEQDCIRTVWTRIFSIYGPYDFSGTLVMTCINKMLRDEPIKMTECTQLWDYLYVSDVADAMVLLADKKCQNGIYNIASGDYKPLKSFVNIIKNALDSKSELQFGAISYDIHGPVNLTPDPSKIKTLGWKPRVSFKEGIDRIMAMNKQD